jgi:hypothetical protein
MADIVAVLRANTSQFTAEMGKARSEVTAMGTESSSAMSKFGSVGKMALMAVSVAAVAVGVTAVEMGSKLEDARAQMDNAFKNAGTTADAYKTQISNVDSQLAKYGFTNTEVEGAIGRLVTVTGKAKPSLDDMGLAADIAKNRQMDLNSAVNLMAKTMAGNVTAAKRMGIEIPPEILKIKDPTDKANAIMAILEERFKGSAAAAADTFAGKIAAMKVQGENLAATLGTKLIPILEKLMTQVTQLVNWFEKHKIVAEALAIAIGVVLFGAIVIYTASLVAAAIAQVAAFWWLDLIIIGVTALVVGIVLLATHWKQVWNDIKNWTSDAVAWIKDHLALIIGAGGPLGLLVVAIVELGTHWKTVWNDIKDVVNVVWGIIKPIFDNLKNFLVTEIGGTITNLRIIWDLAWLVISTAVKLAWDVIKPIWDLIKPAIGAIKDAINGLDGVFSTIFHAIGAAVSSAWNNVIKPVFDAIKSGVNDVKSAISSISAAASAVTNPIASLGHALGFASGGQPPVGVPSIVGEKGPELFVPQSSGTIIPNNALGGAPGMAQANVTINLDGQTFATAVQTVMLQYKRNVPQLGLS